PQYSLVERKIELETLPAAWANGMAILAWSPLAAGFLTGKYTRGEAGGGQGRFARWVDDMDDRGWVTLDVVRDVAKARDVEPATVAIAWLCAKSNVIPIIGATKPEQLDASLAAADLRLFDDEVARLDEAGVPELGYPYDWGPPGGRPPRHLG
ncbi:MAG: aldo/keto reductase, partial [Egibacteraceae bacterium]